MNRRFIWTVGGDRIYLDPTYRERDSTGFPKEPAWDFRTIARSLARIGRWTGHTARAHTLSVAQHCVTVSYFAPQGYELAGLLHDAPEFVLGDTSTPVKQLLRGSTDTYDLYSKAWSQAIEERYGLPLGALDNPKVKRADNLAAIYEAQLLVGVTPEQLEADWYGSRMYEDNDRDGSLARAAEKWPAYIYGGLNMAIGHVLSADDAEREWLRRFEELRFK